MTEKEKEVPQQDGPDTPVEAQTAPQESAANAGDDKLQQLQQQLDETRTKYTYLLADHDNYKRNAARERMDLIQTAGRDILSALLPILDDFDRAAKNGALTEGTTLIHSKLLNTLRAKGLTPVETKPGDDFNPDIHEAVAEIPAPEEGQKGKIVDLLEPAYRLGERIIRFGKVVVGR